MRKSKDGCKSNTLVTCVNIDEIGNLRKLWWMRRISGCDEYQASPGDSLSAYESNTTGRGASEIPSANLYGRAEAAGLKLLLDESVCR